jgi:hypothetical protein
MTGSNQIYATGLGCKVEEVLSEYEVMRFSDLIRKIWLIDGEKYV